MLTNSEATRTRSPWRKFPPPLPEDPDPSILTTQLTTDGYFSFPFQASYYFIWGFVLSPFSFGFIIFLVSLFFNESWYAYRIKLKYTPPHLIYRFGIFGIGLFGFLLGRVLIVGDRYPLRGIYKKDICTRQNQEDYRAHLRSRKK